jgi:hypothetical protein
MEFPCGENGESRRSARPEVIHRGNSNAYIAGIYRLFAQTPLQWTSASNGVFLGKNRVLRKKVLT